MDALFLWLAWRAHSFWVVPARLICYGVHVFFSDREAFLSPDVFQVAYSVSEVPMPQLN